MLGFMQNMLGPKANPIGIDFGTETLRMIQVGVVGGEMKVIAAASADVPGHVRKDNQQRLSFFTTTVKELLVQGKFRGRQVVLGLPSAWLSMVHVRMPVMDEASLIKAIPFEAQGKLPYDPSHGLIRHTIAGEMYHGQERKIEAILMASPRSAVEAYLVAAGKAKLDVVGMNTEPQAILDCFGRLGRRKEDAETVTMYVDVGSAGSRVVMALAGKMMFGRIVGVGGEHFTRAVAQTGKMTFEEACLLRMRLAEEGAGQVVTRREETPVVVEETHVPEESSENSFALLGAGLAKASTGGTATAAPVDKRVVATPPPLPMEGVKAGSDGRMVETAIREPLIRLIEELDMCRRYHDATFAAMPVKKLVFVGGEARHKGLCSFVARELGLAASVGDAAARIGKAELMPDSGFDRRGPQPEWSVALGLTLGAMGGTR